MISCENGHALKPGQKFCVTCGAPPAQSSTEPVAIPRPSAASPSGWVRARGWMGQHKVITAIGGLVLFGAIASPFTQDGTQTGAPRALPTIESPTPEPTLESESPSPSPSPSPKPSPSIKPSPSPSPTKKAYVAPKPKPKATGVFGNPWGYDFRAGKLIYNAPSAFCSYFDCINNFWNGVGYVVQCEDLMFSKSGGRQGVCSHHGGYYRTLYAH